MTVRLINAADLASPPADLYHHVSMASGVRHISIAGQVGGDADGELVARDLAGQIEQAYRNIGSALAAAGASWSDLTKLTFYVVDWRPDLMASLADGMARGSTIGAPAVPATLIGVQSLYAPDVLVEIEATAVAN